MAPLIKTRPCFPYSQSLPSGSFRKPLILIPLKVKVAQSSPTFCNPMDCAWNSLGQNNGVGSVSLLQIFPTQGMNSGLLHCKRTL